MTAPTSRRTNLSCNSRNSACSRRLPAGAATADIVSSLTLTCSTLSRLEARHPAATKGYAFDFPANPMTTSSFYGGIWRYAAIGRNCAREIIDWRLRSGLNLSLSCALTNGSYSSRSRDITSNLCRSLLLNITSSMPLPQKGHYEDILIESIRGHC